MLRKIALFTLILCVFSSGLSAQQSGSPGQKAVELYKEGEQALLEKKPEKALRLFEKALSFHPDLTAARRSMGVCYEMLNNFPKAVEQYDRVLESDSLFSKPLYYQAGEAHYKIGNYEKAMDYFRRYQAFQKNDSIRFQLDNRLENALDTEFSRKLPGTIQACRVAMDSVQFVNITEVFNIGAAINSKADEYFPFLTNDQNTLFFTRLRGQDGRSDENLFFSTRQGGEWSKSAQVSGFNTPNDEGMSTLVRDGRRMFFTACAREGVLGSCDIWQALVNGAEVQSAETLKGFVNSERWESQAAISCDGSVLYFSSNREGGYGGADIWRSERQADGSWGIPKNLGPDINTPLDEEAPFITNDGKTLYFSSTGHLGMGEQDIFISWWDDQQHNWSVPINLGPPVNSAFRELGFFLSADGKTGYFSSNRPGGFGGMDIYFFQLARQLYGEPITFVEGFVRDSIIDIPVQATVEINGRNPAQTDADGRFFLCVGADEVLDIQIDAKRYKPYHNQFAIPEWNNRTFYTIELLLQPTLSFVASIPEPEAEEGNTMVAKGIKTKKEQTHAVFFEFDKSSINIDEIGRLDQFIQSLKGKEIQRVEIIGFSDDVGTDVYNLKLSEERAKQIALFLIDNNIIVDQIYLEGRGEVRNDKPKEQNRRVDVKVATME
jgi:outer membrane protein OmpA-like peptidoglycan-associated protein/tetratricopeptide (TPR) repeat protein